jgi:glutamine amidotransferase
MIAIIDYGVGNLRSVQKAFEQAGATRVLITHDIKKIQQADKVVLPGVGAIKPAMDRLKSLNLIEPIQEVVDSGKLFLGICVGFQLLFKKSFEFGEVDGLGFIDGTVQKFPDTVKVPQIGWNTLTLKNSPLWDGLDDMSDVYFCHSFYAKPTDASVIIAETHYGMTYCSAVCKNNIFGVQFHPEKSQTVGLKILENFINQTKDQRPKTKD